MVPATTGGASTVDRALARLSNHRRLLMLAAHPDDEDTFVLAHVSAHGGEAAYLSLSRGGGGQNLIGPELGRGLGLLRSQELESARRIDGARQYFARAFDFGYTRSKEETFERWPQDELMADALMVARRFKPQVLVAVFPDDERAGHGHHQASGALAEQLFNALSSEQPGPRPWSIDSFYRAGWWNPTAAALQLDLGWVDPFTGRSVFQTALASRSRHRCQDMGFEQPPGDAQAGLIWQGGKGEHATDDLFAGSDTRLAAMAAPLLAVPEGQPLGREVADALARVETLAKNARGALVPSRLSESAPALAEIVRQLSTLAERTRSMPGNPSADTRERLAIVHELISEKLEIAREGLSAAAGIVADAIADRDSLVPGDALEVRSLFWSKSFPVTDLGIELIAGDGWRLTQSRPAEPIPGRFRVQVTDERLHTVAVPETAELSTPYYLRSPPNGDLYDWGDTPTEHRARPFAPPPVQLRFRGRLLGVPMAWTREVVHRYRDQAFGEVRRPLRVVPALEVALNRDLVVRPSQRRDPMDLRVRLVRNQVPTMHGRLEVTVPNGWQPVAPIPFEMAGPPGERQTIDLQVPVPQDLAPGHYELSVSVDGVEGRALQAIEYEHVRPSTLLKQARLDLYSAPIELPEVFRIAYLRGASDRVPEMLREIGLPIVLVTAEDLLTEELDRYDTIVIGSRAFEIEPLLAKANARLIDFVYRGGTVLVQYQQYQYVEGELAPFALDIKRPHDRVTDETAAVRLLEPIHPFFQFPNEIKDEDWQGWVQERGLYFAGTWDPAWTPLLAMFDPIGDPGGGEKQGGLLVLDLGRGRYVYTGLAFFRQLPAGVVGAYRLFVNMLAPKS